MPPALLRQLREQLFQAAVSGLGESRSKNN